jgi:hypothetical protein
LRTGSDLTACLVAAADLAATDLAVVGLMDLGLMGDGAVHVRSIRTTGRMMTMAEAFVDLAGTLRDRRPRRGNLMTEPIIPPGRLTE